MFSTHPKKNVCFEFTIILSSANAFNLDESKNLSFGKELTLYHTILTFKDRGGENLRKKTSNFSFSNNVFFTLSRIEIIF